MPARAPLELAALARRIEVLSAGTPLVRISGQVVEASGEGVGVAGLQDFVGLGAAVVLETGEGRVPGEVIRLGRAAALVKLYDPCGGIKLGQAVSAARGLVLRPSDDWCGRIIDALGRPADGGPPPRDGPAALSVDGAAPPAMSRQRTGAGLQTGLRVIDMFTPVAEGQRIGIFAGSGVGKSTLLGMLARSHGVDRVVSVLVGERGREVRAFVEDVLGEARARAVTVVATGDASPMLRKLAPLTAMRVAEHFRDAGENVLLVMDSVTRYAHACREVALAAGEPPVARGYPPSVFTDLPRLLERAGPGPQGSGCITGIFAVLVDGDDHNDPVADAVRGILDGHIVLDRAVAETGRYPAVDLLRSISRLATGLWTPQQHKLVTRLRALVARFEESRDLRALGGYQAGADPELDQAVTLVPRLYQALRQPAAEPRSADAFRDVAAQLGE